MEMGVAYILIVLAVLYRIAFRLMGQIERHKLCYLRGGSHILLPIMKELTTGG